MRSLSAATLFRRSEVHMHHRSVNDPARLPSGAYTSLTRLLAWVAFRDAGLPIQQLAMFGSLVPPPWAVPPDPLAPPSRPWLPRRDLRGIVLPDCTDDEAYDLLRLLRGRADRHPWCAVAVRDARQPCTSPAGSPAMASRYTRTSLSPLGPGALRKARAQARRAQGRFVSYAEMRDALCETFCQVREARAKLTGAHEQVAARIAEGALTGWGTRDD